MSAILRRAERRLIPIAQRMTGVDTAAHRRSRASRATFVQAAPAVRLVAYRRLRDSVSVTEASQKTAVSIPEYAPFGTPANSSQTALLGAQ